MKTKKNIEKEEEEIIISDITKLKKYFSSSDDNTNNEEVKEDFKTLDKGLSTFFGVEDKYGLTKTDFDKNIVFILSTSLDFFTNPLPNYNKYLIKNGKQKVEFTILKHFIIDIYAKALISKNRLSRKEGENILKGIVESLTEKISEKINPNFGKKIIEDLQR